MVETLILGFLVGVGAAILTAYFVNELPLYAFAGKTTDGCTVAWWDKEFESDPYNLLGIKNSNGDVVAAIKFDKNGIVDTAIRIDAKK